MRCWSEVYDAALPCCLGGMNNYTSEQAGSISGLTLGLHVHQDDYFYASSPAAGFRVITCHVLQN